jgi:hypothetical protein
MELLSRAKLPWEKRHALLYDTRVASRRQAGFHVWEDIPRNRKGRQDDVHTHFLGIVRKGGLFVFVISY